MVLSPENSAKKPHLRVIEGAKSLIKCQEHGESIRTSCGLKACVFWTAYPNVHSCILVYMAKQDVDSLKPIDIGMLKGVSASKISRELAKATNLMRNSTLQVSNQVDIEPKFKTLQEMEVCYECETPINYRNRRTALEVKLPRTKQKIWYCSQSCLDKKPPQFVAAEMNCRTDIKTITAWAVKKYSTLGGLEQALGMNRALLGKTLLELLGVEADELYSTTQRVKTRSKALVRRTGSRPEWLTNFKDVMQPLIDDMTLKYGEPSTDLSDLYVQVREVIDSI
jgi:hypothetical protein